MVPWLQGARSAIPRPIFSFNFAARYGAPSSLADYARKSAAAAHEGHRAFFDGYSKNKCLEL